MDRDKNGHDRREKICKKHIFPVNPSDFRFLNRLVGDKSFSIEDTVPQGASTISFSLWFKYLLTRSMSSTWKMKVLEAKPFLLKWNPETGDMFWGVLFAKWVTLDTTWICMPMKRGCPFHIRVEWKGNCFSFFDNAKLSNDILRNINICTYIYWHV